MVLIMLKLTNCEQSYYDRLKRKGSIYRFDCAGHDVATMNRLTKKKYTKDLGDRWVIIESVK